MFGTFIERRQLIIYPFFEYYRDRNFEYNPVEFGFGTDVDFRGRYRASEGLVLVAYGLTDDIAIEFEAAAISASLDKAATDTSGMPSRIAESGVGDIEGQLRWRWRRETETRPELFSYFEVVVPHAKHKPLIGTPGVELKYGMGLTRGFRWGTLTARVAVEYDRASATPFDLGEYAVEYLRRLTPSFRIHLGIEGSSDEIEFISELQWHIGRRAFVKFNNGIGITSKATDWAPEIGIVFILGR
jgi:hypothetical protein